MQHACMHAHACNVQLVCVFYVTCHCVTGLCEMLFLLESLHNQCTAMCFHCCVHNIHGNDIRGCSLREHPLCVTEQTGRKLYKTEQVGYNFLNETLVTAIKAQRN